MEINPFCSKYYIFSTKTRKRLLVLKNKKEKGIIVDKVEGKQ